MSYGYLFFVQQSTTDGESASVVTMIDIDIAIAIISNIV